MSTAKLPQITAADLTEEEPLLSILPSDDELEHMNRRIDAVDEQLAQLREMTRR